MRGNRGEPDRSRRRGARALLFLVVLALATSAAAAAITRPVATHAATPSPVGAAVTLTVEPMLGAKFDGGSWAAFRVMVANDGPTIDGELRLTRSTQQGSTFGRTVQLATGARQEHVLYGQMGPLTSRFEIALISGQTVFATANVAIDGRSPADLGVYVVAERPERLVGFVGDAVRPDAGDDADIVTLAPEQLPPRVEAWASVDVLVWQDVDSRRLTSAALDALRSWVAIGGRLVIVGGTTGAATLGAFPSDLLPYVPSAVANVPPTDLATLLGAPAPADALPVPALTGNLAQGTAIAESGGSVVAATTGFGQGAVTLIGLDVSTPWLATTGSNALWNGILESNSAGFDPFRPTDEGFISNALGGLPAVQLPPFNDVFLLLLAYVVAIGPLNYVILRRRDRREWAWVTMPAIILVFAVASYGLGALTKGSDVIVNELAIVTVAPGTDRGLAQVYVGVYSPGRADFDVQVRGDALLSPASSSENGRGGPFEEPPPVEGRPMDVLLGDPATVRGYNVGFGSLRAFRAQASVTAPRVETSLRLESDMVVGSVTNASTEPLADVTFVYGGAVQHLGDLAPTETRAVELSIETALNVEFFMPVWDRVVQSAGATGPELQSLAARRAIVQHLAGGWQSEFRQMGGGTGAFSASPVVLAWHSGSTLDIDVGAAAEHVGERLYVIPARAEVSGPIVFSGSLIQRETISADNPEGFVDGSLFYMGRGTMTVEFRPLSFDGLLRPTRLLLSLGMFEPQAQTGEGNVLAPLPPEEQPDPDEPLASNPDDRGPRGIPVIQLLDRVADTWVEFEPVSDGETYEIADPARYLDHEGAVQVRFVLRDLNDFAEFGFGVRIEGTIE